MRIIAQALIAGVALLAPCAFAEPPNGDKIVVVKDSDPDMEAARVQAQSTLDTFLATAAKPPAGTSQFKLKVAISDGANTEHFWVVPFRVTSQGFEGTLNNKPDLVHTVKLGQLITFTRKDISDWGYSKDGHAIGSFSVCALFKKMSAEDVAYYRENYGFDC